MKLKHIALIGSLFPILFSLVLFFGVLISADSDDENSNFSSGITGMKKIDLYRSRHAASVNWDRNTVEKSLPTLAIHASFHRMYDHRSWERSTHNNYNYAHRVPDVNALSFLVEIP